MHNWRSGVIFFKYFHFNEEGSSLPLWSLAVCRLSEGYFQFQFFLFYLRPSAAALIGGGGGGGVGGGPACVPCPHTITLLKFNRVVKRQLLCRHALMLRIYGELLIIFPHLNSRVHDTHHGVLPVGALHSRDGTLSIFVLHSFVFSVADTFIVFS